MNRQGRLIQVYGTVQGVGFRPTVWRLAHELTLHGRVFNNNAGVAIELHGPAEKIRQFTERLYRDCPPLAQITHIRQEPLQYLETDAFFIDNSQAGHVHTPVTADAATCPACRQEIFDKNDRRYGYPFTNCTHCGPRFSIIRAIPYDRQNTSMANFQQCPACVAEYSNPTDRRFHAQPNACPVCGPRLWFQQQQQIITEQPVDAAVKALQQGLILAVKGIGGFHLICDAHNTKAIELLRQRKLRPGKPFALMATDLPQIQQYVKTSALEIEYLTSNAAPIVLLQKTDGCDLPESIAPGQAQLGFMLPHTPLHHLLLSAFNGPLIATSGNVSDLPACIDNAQAIDKLHKIADAFLLHDRDIVNRVDDSIVRQHNKNIQILRRSRGYAPAPLKLPEGFEQAPQILAMGGELKNTFCLIKDGQAILSPHIGDLKNAAAYADYQSNLHLYKNLFEHKPQRIAIDKHPQYLSSRLGHETAAQASLELIPVQHHHAHIAACLAENQWPLQRGKVIGIVLDGLGFGENNELWGGEVLLADYHSFQRLAYLKPAPLPGQAQAMRQPWRNLVAQLNMTFGEDWFNQAKPLHRRLADVPALQLNSILHNPAYSPMVSSMGRLFDAVAAALGLCFKQLSYEGEAAAMLENLATTAADDEPAYSLCTDGHVLDPASLWPALINDLSSGVDHAKIARRFHLGIARGLAEQTVKAAGLNHISHVALSGGVLQNRLLAGMLKELLEKHHLQVMQHHLIPANDGGLALGQAVIAAAVGLQKEASSCA